MEPSKEVTVAFHFEVSVNIEYLMLCCDCWLIDFPGDIGAQCIVGQKCVLASYLKTNYFRPTVEIYGFLKIFCDFFCQTNFISWFHLHLILLLKKWVLASHLKQIIFTYGDNLWLFLKSSVNLFSDNFYFLKI